MNRPLASFCLLFAASAIVLPAKARPADDLLKKIDQSLSAVKIFEQGQDSSPLTEIEKIVFTLPADSALRAPIEQKLISALDSAETSDAKRFLCRQLRVIGTQRSIDSLEKLLTDPEVSSMAVYALGRLESPKVCEAFCRALGKTSGVMQAGLINALGDRHCERAQAELLKLLRSPDGNVAKASARALGKLGGEDAVKALWEVRPEASGNLKLEIDNGLLEVADQLLAAGRKEPAAAIYDAIRRERTTQQFQLAALSGLIQARPEDATSLLVAAIRQGDAELVRGAIALIPTASGSAATKAFAQLLDQLSPDNQVLLLRALGTRGDQAASPAIAAAAQQPSEAVRSAALEALGGAGDSTAVEVLLRAATGEGSDASIARRSLRLVQAIGTDDQLLRMMESDDAAVAAQAIRAAASRNFTAAVPKLLELAHHAPWSLRREAITALGTLASPAEYQKMIDLAAGIVEPADQQVVVAAVARLMTKIDSEEKRVTPLLTALRSAQMLQDRRYCCC